MTVEPTTPLLLTPREIQVLSALAGGHTTRQIAHDLSVSRRMVYHHIQSAKVKLGAASISQAMFTAASLGVIPQEVKIADTITPNCTF